MQPYDGQTGGLATSSLSSFTIFSVTQLLADTPRHKGERPQHYRQRVKERTVPYIALDRGDRDNELSSIVPALAP